MEGIIVPLEVQRHLNTMFIIICALMNCLTIWIEHTIRHYKQSLKLDQENVMLKNTTSEIFHPK